MDSEGELVWHKSSKSTSGGCVSVATGGGQLMHVRDSKDVTGPMLTFHRDTFRGFIAYVKDDGLSRQS